MSPFTGVSCYICDYIIVEHDDGTVSNNCSMGIENTNDVRDVVREDCRKRI